ncbi:MAG: energy transducer TonB [Deltaproteobacteria bacterium]|nr:energy transducer TonB [Deltaproteobacteria bacterium]
MALQIIKNLNNSPLVSGSGRIMKIALFISFFFHAIILMSFQKIIPINWHIEELRTYRVELIRPPVEDINTDDIPETNIERLKDKERPIPEGGQDTISLDTKDKRYITYAGLIKEEIMLHWRYPPEARAYLIEGNLSVLFTLARDGSMTQIRITRASGHKILDREVTRAISNAAPFPPFPGSIAVKRLNIKAAFDYRLTARK